MLLSYCFVGLKKLRTNNFKSGEFDRFVKKVVAMPTSSANKNPSVTILSNFFLSHLYRQNIAPIKIMGIKDVLEYCQVTGAAVLAGELSLIASLAEGSLASAHKRLGRKK